MVVSGRAAESGRCKTDRTFASSVEYGLYGVPTHHRGVQGAGELFACDKQLILLSSVNDDYCDCADGSDEPLTGACPDTTFACALPRRPQQATVPSSRVNDGVCDCCDGSDEWRSAAPCANRCLTPGSPGRTAWLCLAAASLLCVLVGSVCLCQRPEPVERRLLVALRKPQPGVALGLTIANAPAHAIRRWPVISALEVRTRALHTCALHTRALHTRALHTQRLSANPHPHAHPNQEQGLAAQGGELMVGDVLQAVNDQPVRAAEGAHLTRPALPRPALTRPALTCTAPHRAAPRRRTPTPAFHSPAPPPPDRLTPAPPTCIASPARPPPRLLVVLYSRGVLGLPSG